MAYMATTLGQLTHIAQCDEEPDSKIGEASDDGYADYNSDTKPGFILQDLTDIEKKDDEEFLKDVYAYIPVNYKECN